MKWLAAFGLMACASAPRPMCVQGPDSAAYLSCRQQCPDGDALVWENASNTHCICRKPPEGT